MTNQFGPGSSVGEPEPPSGVPVPARSTSGPTRAIRSLAIAVIVLLTVWALASVVEIIVALLRVSLIEEVIKSPGSVGHNEIIQNNNWYETSAVAASIAYFATVVVFLVWLFRARDNAEASSALPHRRSRVWLVLGWIVPVVCFWFPWQIVEDIWRSSDPATSASPTPPGGLRRAGLVYSWWIVWLISGVVGAAFSISAQYAKTLAEIQAVARSDLVSIPLALAAGLLFGLVVWRITAFQEGQRTALGAPLAT